MHTQYEEFDRQYHLDVDTAIKAWLHFGTDPIDRLAQEARARATPASSRGGGGSSRWLGDAASAVSGFFGIGAEVQHQVRRRNGRTVADDLR